MSLTSRKLLMAAAACGVSLVHLYNMNKQRCCQTSQDTDEKAKVMTVVDDGLNEHWEFSMEVEEILAEEKTPFQEILIFKNKQWGTCLVLDGILQLTTLDEHIYHEMFAHVPLMTITTPVSVAIIGGGDGGVLREVVKHPNLTNVTLIDIDQRVIDNSRLHLPTVSSGALDHPKATILAQDGAKWLAQARDLDVILIDSSDPVGPNTSLFNAEFYDSVKRALSPSGIVIKQSGVSLLQATEALEALDMYKAHDFKYFGLYRENVPTYIGGDILYAWASNSVDLEHAPIVRQDIATRHYHPALHTRAFTLPRELQQRQAAIRAS